MNYESGCSVLKLSQVKFPKISICAFFTYAPYGIWGMCRKIKKNRESPTAEDHIFYDVANSLLSTILLIISIIQILLRRASAPTCSGPPPARRTRKTDGENNSSPTRLPDPGQGIRSDFRKMWLY